MKKYQSFLLVFLVSAASQAWAQGIRKPVWDGQFYEKNPVRLASQIDGFLENVPPAPGLPGKIEVVIVPHAGYVYSGQTAAYAYRYIQGKDIDTVVIIGPSHHLGFEGCSIYLKGGYETPLGIAMIAEPVAEQLAGVSGFGYIPEAHEREHSVEVQIPFIQKILPQAKIVPVVMGYPTRKTVQSLADALAKVLKDKKAVVVASSDMSHYLSKKKAAEVDSATISLIQAFQTTQLLRKIEAGENILCGGGAVVAALLYTQGKGTPGVEILQYADSSMSGGPESRVVGYLAAALYTEAGAVALSPEDRKELLRLARLAIKTFLRENAVLDYETKNPVFLEPRGAFVTLKKNGQLRGCIGFVEPILPLYQTVIQAAVAASTRDARFTPVSMKEVDSLEIEISVLTPLRRITDPTLIRVGRHGLLVTMGENSGLFLPQVAVENRWSREVFLRQTCLKAGLPQNAWKTGAEIYIFEVVVFH